MNAGRRVDETVFRFGSFELTPARRLLCKDGRTVKVGSRALDLLVTLVESAGTVVTKRDLLSRVWANVVVEDTNLRVQVSILRRLLGDDGLENRYILHVARRGYVFVAPLGLSNCSAWSRESMQPLPTRSDSHPSSDHIMEAPSAAAEVGGQSTSVRRFS